MLNTQSFGNLLKEYGFDFYSGVPCSLLSGLINYAINECDYLAAVNEGDAVASCVGAYLGGKKPVFLCQNSGLGNAVSPLTSLADTYKIPLLGFVSLRGDSDIEDEPQHHLMGKLTPTLLDAMSIHWVYLADELESAKRQLEQAITHLNNHESFVFVVKKNSLSKIDLTASLLANEKLEHNKILVEKNIHGDSSYVPVLVKRYEILDLLNQIRDKATRLLTTTGYTSRELCQLSDDLGNFYMVGSMGCLASLSLGLALAQPNKKIIAIDGDGAVLMRAGALALNGYLQTTNLLHIVLDNHAYESTGGQSCVSQTINMPLLANAMGYQKVLVADSLENLKIMILNWTKQPQLTFIYVRIQSGCLENLGRPNLSPEATKERFMSTLSPH